MSAIEFIVWGSLAAMGLAVLNQLITAAGSTYCPHCKGKILRGANICQHCNRDLK